LSRLEEVEGALAALQVESIIIECLDETLDFNHELK
jgi:hypothetical protein